MCVQLRDLRLNGNVLQRLRNHDLAPASQLVRLELSECQLRAVEPRAFQGNAEVVGGECRRVTAAVCGRGGGGGRRPR